MSQAMFEQQLDFDNLSDEDKEWLKSWNREDLIPVEEREDSDELIYDVENLLKPELQSQARLRELDDSGTVAELKERIMEHDDAQEYEDEEEE